MGNWKLEVFRMTLYIAFPVGSFLLFNTPSFYEKTILEGRRALAACYDPEQAEMLRRHLEKKEREYLDQEMQKLKEKSSREN